MIQTLPALLISLLVTNSPIVTQASTPSGAHTPMAKVIQRIAIPPAAMVVDGVPAIPDSPMAIRKIGLYSASAEATLMDWSRKDRTMLIKTVSTKTNSRQIYDLKTPMGRPRQRTSFQCETTASLWQPGKTETLVIAKDDDGNELRQVYRLDPKKGTTTLLSDGKSTNSYPVWSPRGDRVAFCAIHRNEKSTGICIVDPSNPTSLKEIAQLTGANWDDVTDWSPDGKNLLVVSGDAAVGTRMFLVNASTGEKVDVTPSKKVAIFMPVGFTADSSAILVATNLDSEFRRLAYMDIASRKLTFITPDNWDVDAYFIGDYEWPAMSQDRKWLAFAMNEDGLSTLHVLDVATGKVRDIPCPAPGLVRNIHWNGNNREFAFNLVSNQNLGDIYSIDITTNKSERWTKLGPRGLDLSQNATPELVKWTSFDQREISGWLYRPPAKFQGKRPVIIDIHGGPTEQFRPQQLAYKNYFINELGIVMIFPNIRGSMGYGKTFLDLDNGYKREDSCRDIEALLDWIKKDPTLDSTKIMIQGHSYGGYMGFTLATKLEDRVACYSVGSGISNLVSMSEQTTGELVDYFTREFGDLHDPKAKAFLEAISPIANVRNIKRPMLVMAGKNDPRVSVKQADTMVTAIKSHGTPVWYLRAGNEGHDMRLKDNVSYQLLTTISFIRTYLLGHAVK